MNTNDPRFELIRRCRDGDASNEELRQLEALLRSDRGFRQAYVRYTNLEVASCSVHKSREMPVGELSVSKQSRTGSLSLRPLSAAAAGLALGLLCAGSAWAVAKPWQTVPQYAGPRVNIVLVEESFENPEERPTKGFPASAGVWGGDRTAILGGKEGLNPFHGERMVRLAPSPATELSYLGQIIDLRNLPRAGADEVRQIEVTASFHADSPGFRERYTLRVATFVEDPGSLKLQWMDVAWQAASGRSLSLCKRSLSTQVEDEGWQTLTALVEAPSEASTVVISLAAGRHDAGAPKSPHYLDDVRARLVISPRALMPRNKQ